MSENELLWKATRPDGTTRRGVRWAVGETVTHPTSTSMVRDEPATYLSLSAEPGETLIGGSWPCRLFRVRPVGEAISSDRYPHKWCVLAAEVIEEVPAWQALGPNGRTVAAVIDRCRRLSPGEVDRAEAARAAARVAARAAARDAAGVAAWVAAGDAARAAAWVAAGDAARDAAGAAAGVAAWDAAGVAAGVAAWDAARAGVSARVAARVAVVMDLITPAQYDLLTGPLVSVVGPLDDLPVPAWVASEVAPDSDTAGEPDE